MDTLTQILASLERPSTSILAICAVGCSFMARSPRSAAKPRRFRPSPGPTNSFALGASRKGWKSGTKDDAAGVSES